MKMFGKGRLKQKERVMEQYIVRLYRGLGTSLAKHLVDTKIMPNHITITGFIFVIAASLFFATGEYVNLIIGAAIIFLTFVLDFTDGTLARMRNQASILGDWMDAMADDLREVLVTVSLCIGLYRNVDSTSVWMLGFIALAADRLIFRTTSKLYKVLPYSEKKISQEVKNVFSRGTIFRITKEFLSVRLFKYTLLPIFIISGNLFAYMVFAAVYGTVLCIAFFAYSIIRIKKEESKRKQ